MSMDQKVWFGDDEKLKPHCNGSNGYYFCPLVMGCIPNHYNCTIDTMFPSEYSVPWGGRCSNGLTYCLYLKCVFIWGQNVQ